MDRLAAITTLLRVAECGSFTRAADQLEISRAQASQQIAWLERSLGVKLLNRTTRKVSLTSDGAEYVEHAGRALTDLRQAEESLVRSRERPQGRLRVDVPVAAGRHLLIPALPEFQRRFPDLHLDVQLNDRVVDLAAERIDIAVRFGPITDQSLVARRIGVARMLTCAAPAYLLEAGVPRQIDDLVSHRCIGYTTQQSGRVRDWNFRQGGRQVRERVPCQLTFNTAEAVLGAALAGAGIAQVADLLVVRHLATGRLQSLLVEYTADFAPLSIVYLKGKRVSAAVKVFSEFMISLMQKLGDPTAARISARSD